MLDTGQAAELERSGASVQGSTAASKAWTGLEHLSAGIVSRRLDGLDALVVTKFVAGFDDACVDALRRIVRDAAAGRPGRLKFLIFDFAHREAGESAGGEGFEALVSEAANLILEAPVVSVAWSRGYMAGADLKFALACSMIVGEEGARYSFAADPLACVQTYSLLAQKIGFVRAERLMEGAEVLDGEAMRGLLLLKDLVRKGPGLSGIKAFVGQRARRHNSSYGIYRAQRIAMPVTVERRSGARRA